jgi:hypothetical protein
MRPNKKPTRRSTVADKTLTKDWFVFTVVLLCGIHLRTSHPGELTFLKNIFSM